LLKNSLKEMLEMSKADTHLAEKCEIIAKVCASH
jgi:hypothetical protein